MSEFFALDAAGNAQYIDDAQIVGRVTGDVVLVSLDELIVSERFRNACQGLRGASLSSVNLRGAAPGAWFRLQAKTVVEHDPFAAARADDLEQVPGRPQEWRVRSYNPAPQGWDEADFFRNRSLRGIWVTARAAAALDGLRGIDLTPADADPHLWEGLSDRDDALLAEIRARH